MDLLVNIFQIVHDLLAGLNPLRLFRADYRHSFREAWRQRPLVARIGYVLGTAGLLMLISLIALWMFKIAST